jgi:hypothetical protein
MTDRLKSGAAWLSQQMRAHAASTVTYTRGPEAVPIDATKGRTTFEQNDASGVLARVDSIDFLIDPTTLILAGVETRPQRGDTVTDADGVVYTVYPANGEDCWRWSGGHRYTLRIHTKVTEETDPDE